MTEPSDTPQPVAPRKSFYDLNIYAAPGGCNADTHYIRGTLGQVRHDLESVLQEGIHLYLFCWYGASLSLDVFQNGEQNASINVLPYLTISIKGYPDITFDERGKPIGYDFSAEDEQLVTDTSLAAKMFNDELEAFSVRVDWEAMAVPPLDEPVAQKGDLVSVDDEWDLDDGEHTAEDLLDDGFLRCGVNDLVAGEWSEDPL